MQGAFEVDRLRRRPRRAVRAQMSPRAPITWDSTDRPRTRCSATSAGATTPVSSDVLLEQAGYVELIGRAGTQHAFGPAGLNAYYLRVTNTGAWSIFRNNTNDTITTLAQRHGHRARAPAPGTHLALTFSGTTHHRRDRRRRRSARSPTPRSTAARSASGRTATRPSSSTTCPWSLAGSATPTGTIVGGATWPCLDDNSGSTDQRHPDRDVGLQRRRQPEVDDELKRDPRVYGSSCLDVTGEGTANGTRSSCGPATAAPTSSGCR